MVVMVAVMVAVLVAMIPVRVTMPMVVVVVQPVTVIIVVIRFMAPQSARRLVVKLKSILGPPHIAAGGQCPLHQGYDFGRA
jgi:hypothetical protein